MKIDQVMIGLLVDKSALALLAVSSKLNEGLLMLPMVLVGMYYPHMLRLHKKVTGELIPYLGVVKRNAFIIVASVYSLVFISSDILIPTLYGPDYIQSSGLLKVQALTLFLTFYGMLASRLCVIFSCQKLVLYSNLLGLVLNVALNIVFIPIFNVYGAAIATLLTQALTSYLFWKINPKTKKLF
ncbi:polysaccharide biosynthesis C-terminal domain-containing protein, partial [Vibrio sp. D173a]|uniref:polysaccharide biosynthesis C-terminal domain-containing protein n=1 Tax=Vibrio sp. D173a TaxID=2836349 RepID=UPI0025555468